jgi:hypothetical protein
MGELRQVTDARLARANDQLSHRPLSGEESPPALERVLHPRAMWCAYRSQRWAFQCSSETIEIGTPLLRISAAFMILFPNEECFHDSVA